MWRSSRDSYVPQKSVEVTADNGLSFEKGKRITLTLPNTIDFISPHESYLMFDLTLSGGLSPVMCREDVGASAIFQAIRCYDNNSGELLEELTDYATWVANSNHYKLDRSQHGLQGATEGVVSGFQVLGNPYFSSTSGNETNSFRTTRFCVPLRLGMFQQEDAIPNKMIPLRFEFELERDMAKVVQRINGVGVGQTRTAATDPAPASWGNSVEDNAGNFNASPFILELGSNLAPGDLVINIKGGGVTDELTPVGQSDGNIGVTKGLGSFPIKKDEFLGIVSVTHSTGVISKVETGFQAIKLNDVTSIDAAPDQQFSVSLSAGGEPGAVAWSGSRFDANAVGQTNYLVSLNGFNQEDITADAIDRAASLDTFVAPTYAVGADLVDGTYYVLPTGGTGSGLVLKVVVSANDYAEVDVSIWAPGTAYTAADTVTIASTDLGGNVPGGGTADGTINVASITSAAGTANVNSSLSTPYNYAVDNFRMIVNEVKPGSDYLSRAARGMDYHIKSFQNYKFNIPVTETRGSYVVPISNSRCYAIFCVPVKQGAYTDADFDRHDIIHGTRDNLQRFQYQIAGKLEPDRMVECVVEREGQMVEPQFNYELQKSFSGCGIEVKNMRNTAQAFHADIQLGEDMFSRDLRGIDVNLNTEYDGNQKLNKLVQVYACNLRTAKISPLGVTIVR